MVPSWAVFKTVIVLLPTLRLILPDAEADATVVPLTLTVALAWFTVGVTVREVTALLTDAV